MAVSATGPRYSVHFLLSTFCFDGKLTSRRQIGRVPFAFEKLLVYQKSVAFADAVCARTRSFPRGYTFLADQLNRAALSIATNIAEGNGRFTLADRRNFFGIARGSVQECVPLLEILRQRIEATRIPSHDLSSPYLLLATNGGAIKLRIYCVSASPVYASPF